MNTPHPDATTSAADAPWKERFRAPAIFWAHPAENNPQRGLVATNRAGFVQLYGWDVASGELRQLTHTPEGRVMGSLSPDGAYVYYLQDQGGNELGHFVRFPFTRDDTGALEDITPDLPPYSPSAFSFSRSGNLLGLGYSDANGSHFYSIPMAAAGQLGERRLLYTSRSLTLGLALSQQGDLAVIGSTERSGKLQFSLIALRTANGEQLAELWDGEESSIEPAFFSPVPGDNRLVATTTRSGYRRPLLWNPVTGERLDLPLPALDGEILAADWSADGEQLLLVQFSQAQQRLYRYHLPTHTLHPLDHPSGSFGNLLFRPNGEIWATWQDAQQPGQVIRLDGQTGQVRGTLLQAGAVPPGQPWRSVHFPSSDEELIQAWLATPPGPGPFPVILETHGGPTAAQTEDFAPGAQCWLDHGFAYLSVNYRGSTTFGREFQDKILGTPGYWEVEDIVAARRWLIESGLAIPDKILLTGWSYGGYLTLQTLGKYPGLWAGGMAGIAIADWHMMYNESADLLRQYQTSLFGGSPSEKPEAYTAGSPITYVAQVDAPVLIIQGRSDTRTPPRPVIEYERQMRVLGKAIEVVWFESGHLGSFTNVEQGIEHQEIMLRFAQRIVQGR